MNIENQEGKVKKIEYLNETELKRHSYTSKIFMEKYFLIRKSDFKRICGTCKEEFSVKSSTATLNRHLASKHEINKAKEEKEFLSCSSGSEKEIGGEEGDITMNSIEVNLSKKKIITDEKGQRKLIEIFVPMVEKPLAKEFAILKCKHSLSYRLFDSPYFSKALQSYRLSKTPPKINSHIIRSEWIIYTKLSGKNSLIY